MADAWELVLHHTYAGASGVVFDHSPTRRSHGQPVDIADADFLADGAAPGSGAVALRNPTSAIRVPASDSWRPLGAVRVEMVLETDVLRRGGVLVTADSFSFHANGDGFFSGDFSQTSGGSSTVGRGGSEPRPLPLRPWVTIALQYDLAGVQAEVDDEVVQRWDGWNGYLLGTDGLIIGNDRTGRSGLRGAIDELRIWRWNRHALGTDFTQRPVDDAVARCWAQWSRRLNDVLAANADCARDLADRLPRALFSVMNDIDGRPGVEPGLTELARRYQQLWSEGRLREIPAVLADIIGLLRGAGFHPSQIADLQALLGSHCFGSLAEQLPITCDPGFTEIFTSVAESF